MAEDRRRPPKFSTETRKSDPRRTNDENFASFMGFLDERFYDVDRHACRVKKGVRSYTYSLHLVRCGVARLAAFETDAMTLRYSIRKNRYHSFIKLMMPTSGTFTITVNGVRTVRLAPGEALLFDPTEDITYAAVKDTKGISLLVASNYFHARTRFQAALFKVLPILGKTARERCFLAVLRAVHDYLGDMTPEEAEDYKALTENPFVLGKTPVPLFYGAACQDVNTIGGFANWVQDAEYTTCPHCGKPMKYLAQIQWDTVFDCAEGTLYVEFCPDCHIVSMQHQQT